jgi:glycosyltransferase involved in cell wall biosynthesis
MKILYFHQHFSTPKGGTGIRSYAMAKALIGAGHSVTMVCGSYGVGQTGLEGAYVNGVRRGTYQGIEIVEFELPYSNRLSFLNRLVLFLQFAIRSVMVAFREDYDVLFATTTPLTAGIPGILAKWLRRKPFVFEVRDLWPELPRAMGVIKNPVGLFLMSILEWCSYRSADRLVGLSPGIVEGIHRRGGRSDKIVMIPNGCDIDIFSSHAMPWRPAGISEDDLMAVFAGTHGMANGLDAVLDAAAVLKRRSRSDIKILLIGDGQLKAQLMKRARNEQLDNVFFHEPVNKTLLAGLMASTDIGLQILANVPAFYYGTSPNKFFDYIASGVPVLNNYPGWLSELISLNKCGISVPPEDPEAFASSLEQAADDRASLKKMGLAARALAESRFNRAKLANEFVAWIEGAGL